MCVRVLLAAAVRECVCVWLLFSALGRVRVRAFLLFIANDTTPPTRLLYATRIASACGENSIIAYAARVASSARAHTD